MKNIVIANVKKVEEKTKKFRDGGLEKIHVLADFDRTLTQAFVDGKKTPSLIGVLRDDEKYLGKNYAKRAQELFEKYHPIETDPFIDKNEKRKAMEKWWTEHFDILIEKGLSKKHLKEVVSSEEIRFRDGFVDFLDFLDNNKIPLVIMSASGLGGEVIEMMIDNKRKMSSNIYIISNSFVWNKSGRVVDFKKPIVHSLNKDETILKSFSCYNAVAKRKNVLLLGDNLEDLGMIDGFDYDNLLSIGFLNEKVSERLPHYKEKYDVVILNDSSMSFVSDILKTKELLSLYED